ncbi:MAG: metallophosphoesterase family protein [Balneolaceae bacterium]
MKLIAHISDLHFGREDPAVAEGLVADLHRLQPALVINSGDFTQRARRSQYLSAAEFMKRLPHPQLSVPGNHDIPLFDLVRRFLSPLKRYRKFISKDLFPRYRDDGLMVLGINTARSLTWKSGRISLGQMEEMERVMSSLPPSLFKIMVTHHPFIPPPGQEDAGVTLVGRAARALEVFERCGVDLLLSGHLHHGYTGDIRTFYPSAKRSIVVLQAGTAISRRVRHEPNGYNVIRLEEERIDIEVRRWEKMKFSEAGRILFTLEDGRWVSKSGKSSIKLSS